MVVAVESSTLKSFPAHCISSALIKTVSGSFIPESVADLASLITGKYRVLMADKVEDKADHRVVGKANHQVVDKANHRVVARAVGIADRMGVMLDHRKVRVISPHFFSN